MSYNKKNWKTGDYVTQEDINNIENGIYEAHTNITDINTDISNMNADITDIKDILGVVALNTTDKTLKGAINELFQFVSNGKELIASAITDKGVITSSTDTFEQMANNIRSITIPDIGNSNLLDSTGAYMVDDFTGSLVDRNKWNYELGYVRNGELQNYTSTNTEVSNSILALKGIKDSNGNWTSSSIISKGRFAFMYGKI